MRKLPGKPGRDRAQPCAMAGPRVAACTGLPDGKGVTGLAAGVRRGYDKSMILYRNSRRQGLVRFLLVCLLSLGLAGLLLTGCETVEGFGRDVENTGEALEDAAD